MKNEIKNETVGLPFFSVIITTYNRASLLKRALDSLIAQTETDWEAIIVDDDSTDGDELVEVFTESDEDGDELVEVVS